MKSAPNRLEGDLYDEEPRLHSTSLLSSSLSTAFRPPRQIEDQFYPPFHEQDAEGENAKRRMTHDGTHHSERWPEGQHRKTRPNHVVAYSFKRNSAEAQVLELAL